MSVKDSEPHSKKRMIRCRFRCRPRPTLCASVLDASVVDPDPHISASNWKVGSGPASICRWQAKMYGIWDYLSTFSRFWAFPQIRINVNGKIRIRIEVAAGSGSVSKWKVGSGSASKWQAGSGSASRWIVGSGSASNWKVRSGSASRWCGTATLLDHCCIDIAFPVASGAVAATQTATRVRLSWRGGAPPAAAKRRSGSGRPTWGRGYGCCASRLSPRRCPPLPYLPPPQRILAVRRHLPPILALLKSPKLTLRYRPSYEKRIFIVGFSVLRSRIRRIRMFLGLLDCYIIKQK